VAGKFSVQKTWVILRWEYRQKILSRSFLFSLVFIPFVLITFTGLPAYLAQRPAPSITIGVSTAEQASFGVFAHEAGVRHPEWTLVEVDDGMTVDHARSLIRKDVMDAVVMLPASVVVHASDFKSAMELELLLTRFRWLLETQKRPLQIDRIEVSVPNGQIENYIAGLILVLAVFFAIFNSAGSFMRGFLEERSGRVLEILISSVRPLEIMTGKIAGLALVGLTQIAVWTVFAWLIGTGHWTRALTGPAGLWIVLYFILGYFFYAAVFGALGAVFTSEHDIQPIQSVLSIAGVIPIALAVLVLDEPDSTVVRVLSYIPFVTPTIMVLRIAVADPSLLERCLAAFTLLAGGAVMMKIAASLFDRAARFQRIRRPT
jgi:ABC-2 type transport system permease protein